MANGILPIQSALPITNYQGLEGKRAPEASVAPVTEQLAESTEEFDRVTLSKEAQVFAEERGENTRDPADATLDGSPTDANSVKENTQANSDTEATTSGENKEDSAVEENPDKPSGTGEKELDAADQQLVKELKARDLEVRAHEAAHLRAAGSHARGGAKFEYQKGPDGKQYAVGGHVNIDVSKVPNDPEATIRKAEQVRRAALAPAEPSSKDRQVAAKASGMIIEAQQELSEQRLEELTANSEEVENTEEASSANDGTSEEDKEEEETNTIPPTDGTELFDGFTPITLTTGGNSGEKDENANRFGFSAYTKQADTSNGSLIGGGISLIA